MHDDKRQRPTLGAAALGVSVLALVVALTGIATGLPGKNKIDKNDLKANVVKSKHIGPDALDGSDIAESSLGEVPTAGAPFAYARVLDPVGPGLGVDESRSKLITDAMLAEDNGGLSGKTCFDLPFAVSAAQVTVDYAQAADETEELSAQVAVGDPFGNCNAPAKDAIVSMHTDLGGTVDRGFYIAFYR